jgi:hypothetical protein
MAAPEGCLQAHGRGHRVRQWREVTGRRGAAPGCRSPQPSPAQSHPPQQRPQRSDQGLGEAQGGPGLPPAPCDALLK